MTAGRPSKSSQIGEDLPTDDADDLAERYRQTIEGWLESLRWRYQVIDQLPPWRVDQQIAEDEALIAATLREACAECDES